jgi:hypothetical protein
MVEKVDRKQREGIQEEARARYSRECPRDCFPLFSFFGSTVD